MALFTLGPISMDLTQATERWEPLFAEDRVGDALATPQSAAQPWVRVWSHTWEGDDVEADALEAVLNAQGTHAADGPLSGPVTVAVRNVRRSPRTVLDQVVVSFELVESVEAS
jgi:hypothetical protein